MRGTCFAFSPRTLSLELRARLAITHHHASISNTKLSFGASEEPYKFTEHLDTTPRSLELSIKARGSSKNLTDGEKFMSKVLFMILILASCGVR